MTIKGVKCQKCGRGLYSRARHDFRACPCGSGLAVDGGLAYLKVTFREYDDHELADFEVEGVSAKELYEDWRSGKDQYGIIEAAT